MNTKLRYLETPAPLTCESVVENVAFEFPRLTLALAETPFFPKGGGQPCDIGVIEGAGFKMNVDRVLLEDGVALHSGILASGEAPQVGARVWASADYEHRSLTARTHTGGEVICAAVHELGRRWVVTAAGHVPGQSRVAFEADGLDNAQVQAFTAELAAMVHTIIGRDSEVRTFLDVPEDEVRRLCPLEPLDHLPAGAPIRLVFPAPGFFRPCMGAHVARAGDVGEVTFKKVRLRDGELSISYDVAHTERSRAIDEGTVSCL